MFRRKKSDDDAAGTAGADGTDELAGPDEVAAEAAPDGPRDVGEVDLEDGVERIDLGGLLIVPPADLDVQLQVDEASGEVAAVLLAGQEGAVELRPFAAPRNGDIWEDVRRQVAAEVARRGGTATEQDGPQGPELKVSLAGATCPTAAPPPRSRGSSASPVRGGWCGPRCSGARPSSTGPTGTWSGRCATSSWSGAAPRSRPASR